MFVPSVSVLLSALVDMAESCSVAALDHHEGRNVFLMHLVNSFIRPLALQHFLNVIEAA